MKTIVVAKHEPGPAENGHDGCHARWGNNGICPGVQTAEWLNSLGEDDEHFVMKNGEPFTCGQVRDNWLRNNSHIVARDPEMAKLRAEERRLSAQLRITRKRIKQLSEPVGVAK